MLKGDFFGFLFIVATIAIAILPLAHCQGTSFRIARPKRLSKCGDVDIPYPFGIGDGCHYDHPLDGKYYKLTCNYSRDPVVPIHGINIEVQKITLEGEFRIINENSYACYNSSGNRLGGVTTSISVKRFAVSTTQNIGGAIGCDTLGFFNGIVRKNSTVSNFLSGCATSCTDQTDVGDKCSGIGCCLASIPDGITNITQHVRGLTNHSGVQQFNPCSFSFVVAKKYGAENEMPFSIQSILTQDVSYFRNRSNLLYPVVYNWSIGTKDCASAVAAGEKLLCKGNSTCLDSLPGQWGYRCHCKPGFEGNPYLYDCTDIDECTNKSLNSCEKQEYCFNSVGNYSCKCPKGYHGKATKDNPCIPNDAVSREMLLLAIKIIVGVGGGIIVSLLCCFWFHWRHGNKKLQKMKETYFHQNGGHILKQKLSGRDVQVGNMVRMFTFEELKKATDNYSENSMIGRGGFGIVYKGTLSIKEMSPITK